MPLLILTVSPFTAVSKRLESLLAARRSNTSTGSWKNPPPGTPAPSDPLEQSSDPEHKLGQKIKALDDPIARENFRVVIIRPDEVERTDLENPETGRRWRWSFDEGAGEWREQVLWP